MGGYYTPPLGGGSGGSLLKVATVTLTGAQLAALNSTPVEILAAPGTGKVFVQADLKSALQSTVGTTPYSVFTNALVIRLSYGDPADAKFFASVEDLIDGGWLGADRFGAFGINFDVGGSGAKSQRDNKAINALIVNGTGRITASNRTAGNFGTGYIPTETFTPTGTNAQGVVDTVDGLGAVLTYHLVAQGASIAPTNAVDCPGDIAGTGFQIDITAIQSVSGGDGTVTLTIPYIVVTLQ